MYKFIWFSIKGLILQTQIFKKSVQMAIFYHFGVKPKYVIQPHNYMF